MSRGAHYNRNSRRSGGDKQLRIHVGGREVPGPALAIQCFEGRHSECTGVNTLFPEPCECPCHARVEALKP